MGNRAVVFFKGADASQTGGVYLHWNGGPESILAFLGAMLDRKWMRPDYASARFVQVVGEFFDLQGDCQGLSLGICARPPIIDDVEALEATSPGDNGVYVVTITENDFQVVQHVFRKPKKFSVLKPPKMTQKDQEQMAGIREALEKSRAARIKAAKEAA